MSGADTSSTKADLYSEILGRGALAGVMAACDRVTRQSQVQNLLEIIGLYRGKEAVEILTLFIAYKVGNGLIGKNTGRQIIDDLLYIYRRVKSGGNVTIDDALSSYLGALKWSYTAVSRGYNYHVCRMMKNLKPDVMNVVEAIMRIQGQGR